MKGWWKVFVEFLRSFFRYVGALGLILLSFASFCFVFFGGFSCLLRMSHIFLSLFGVENLRKGKFEEILKAQFKPQNREAPSKGEDLKEPSAGLDAEEVLVWEALIKNFLEAHQTSSINDFFQNHVNEQDINFGFKGKGFFLTESICQQYEAFFKPEQWRLAHSYQSQGVLGKELLKRSCHQENHRLTVGRALKEMPEAPKTWVDQYEFLRTVSGAFDFSAEELKNLRAFTDFSNFKALSSMGSETPLSFEPLLSFASKGEPSPFLMRIPKSSDNNFNFKLNFVSSSELQPGCFELKFKYLLKDEQKLELTHASPLSPLELLPNPELRLELVLNACDLKAFLGENDFSLKAFLTKDKKLDIDKAFDAVAGKMMHHLGDDFLREGWFLNLPWRLQHWNSKHQAMEKQVFEVKARQTFGPGVVAPYLGEVMESWRQNPWAEETPWSYFTVPEAQSLYASALLSKQRKVEYSSEQILRFSLESPSKESRSKA